MTLNTPRGSNAQRRELRIGTGTSSRYLARTRPQRLATRPQSSLGPSFFLVILASLGAAIALVMIGAVISVYSDCASDLPPVTNLTDRLTFQTGQILDRNGQLLYELEDQNGGKRITAHLGDISPYLVDATIATEDKDFYSNAGFDPMGTIRAVVQNVTRGQILWGGSTITQQLAKNVLLAKDERTDQSYGRKMREAILALKISQSYPKDQILEQYLNEVYYGHLSNGVEAAARTYFERSAGDLTLGEAAMLAGLPQAPSQYDPFLDFPAAKARQAHVLDRMVVEAYITPGDAARAKVEPLRLQSQRATKIKAPHFFMYVRQLLEQRSGGLRLPSASDNPGTWRRAREPVRPRSRVRG